MNDKVKVFWKIFLSGLLTGIVVMGAAIIIDMCTRKPDNKPGVESDSDLIAEIRRIDNVIEGIGQQVRTGLDRIETGVSEIKGLTESTRKRTDTITAGISRIEEGTGQAIGYSESVIKGFTRIETTIADMGREIGNQGLDGAGIGADIREQVEILRKGLGIEQVGDDR